MWGREEERCNLTMEYLGSKALPSSGGEEGEERGEHSPHLGISPIYKSLVVERVLWLAVTTSPEMQIRDGASLPIRGRGVVGVNLNFEWEGGGGEGKTERGVDDSQNTTDIQKMSGTSTTPGIHLPSPRPYCRRTKVSEVTSLGSCLPSAYRL